MAGINIYQIQPMWSIHPDYKRDTANTAARVCTHLQHLRRDFFAVVIIILFIKTQYSQQNRLYGQKLNT